MNRHFASPANGPIVVKIGGAALEDTTETAQVAAAIATLHQCSPSGVVIVHGGGTSVDQHLARLGLVSEKRHGIRITPPEHIDEVVAVLAGKVNKRLVGQLQAVGLPAVGLCLGDGFLIRSAKDASTEFDCGYVGQMVGGDPLLVQTLLPAGFVPVISSIGLDAAGHPLNVNADDAATDVARLLRASSLLLLTNVSGVYDEHGELLPTLTAMQVDELIARGVVSDGMVPKVRSALSAANDARVPVTIASWRDISRQRHEMSDQWPGTRLMPLEMDCSVAANDLRRQIEKR